MRSTRRPRSASGASSASRARALAWSARAAASRSRAAGQLGLGCGVGGERGGPVAQLRGGGAVVGAGLLQQDGDAVLVRGEPRVRGGGVVDLAA
ncbi:hypothetical protein ETD83_10770 [Actinomadura soli]|uniref:Uncharacterized protein n=1 Tax=Actinomadura soli TaxID=2508997 RepID=A0A5C4JEW4_9ACTN|nr:hypothetical protein [Actinomadura soli]TMR03383.1 hypothetical protein ETD83_10770 [Actinomadura soli]